MAYKPRNYLGYGVPDDYGINIDGTSKIRARPFLKNVKK